MLHERRTESNLPTTVTGLRAWLSGTDAGRLLFSDLASSFLESKCRACEKVRPYPKVLVVLRRIGSRPGAEVYAERGVSTRFLEMPDIPDDGDFVAWTEGLMEIELPRSWKHMIALPRRQVSSEVFRGVTLGEAFRCECDLTVLRGWQEINQNKEDE